MIDAERFPTEPFQKLCAIVEALRSPNGCPWDKEQTPNTLRNGLLEETYEAVCQRRSQFSGIRRS